MLKPAGQEGQRLYPGANNDKAKKRQPHFS